MDLKKATPVLHYVEWKWAEWTFAYYDKDKGENKLIKLPLKFILLDELTTVKWFHMKDQSGIYANEIRDISNEELTVKIFSWATLATGTWNDIKNSLPNGAKFSKSVYAYCDKLGWIINIQFNGSSLGPWMDKDCTTRAIQATKNDELLKYGTVEYYSPNFENYNATKKEVESAEEAFNELQAYLSSKGTTQKNPKDSEGPAEMNNESLNSDEDLPF